MIKVTVRSHNHNDPNRMENKVKVRGYSKYMTTHTKVVWMNWFHGLGFYRGKPFEFEFWGKVEESAAFRFFLNWLREKDPELILKHIMENPHLCYHCVHMPFEHCPVSSTEIPLMKNDEVKQCDMFFHENNCEGG